MRDMTSTLPVEARARRYRELAAKMRELAVGCRMSDVRASYLVLSKCWSSLADESERSAQLERELAD
jgi:hypothetical protein